MSCNYNNNNNLVGIPGVVLATVTVQTTKGYLRAADQNGTLDALWISVTKTLRNGDHEQVPHTRVSQ